MPKTNNNTTDYILKVDTYAVLVSRKEIKNIYLKVNSRSKKIRISAPKHISDNKIESFVRSKCDWIEKQLAKKVKVPTKLNYIDGEEHYFNGRKYKLKIVEQKGAQKVLVTEDELILYTKLNSTRQKREKLLQEWYRAYLKENIPKIIDKYEDIMEVEVKEFGVKKMRTRWGTCNIKAKRIWLSLELAKKSEGCLEMVVVHEMVHLLERLHTKRFYVLMSLFMPNWKTFDKELKGSGID